jgi:glutamine amidotransferase
LKNEIVVIDYGRGNLRSVVKALEAVGSKARVSSAPRDLESARGLILPGVGAFGDAMAALSRLKLVAPLKKAVAQGKPVLGICLGLQLFFDKSLEYGAHRGFGFFKGTVRKFTGKEKVPHMGWNQVWPDKGCPLFAGIRPGEDFYFVHSYRAPASKSAAGVAATTEYGGGPFASAVWKDNLFATQFHPEKSQKAGLKIYKNFLEIVQRTF